MNPSRSHQRPLTASKLFFAFVGSGAVLLIMVAGVLAFVVKLSVDGYDNAQGRASARAATEAEKVDGYINKAEFDSLNVDTTTLADLAATMTGTVSDLGQCVQPDRPEYKVPDDPNAYLSLYCHAKDPMLGATLGFKNGRLSHKTENGLS